MPTGSLGEESVRSVHDGATPLPSNGLANEDKEDAEFRIFKLRHQSVDEVVRCLSPGGAIGGKKEFEAGHSRVL